MEEIEVPAKTLSLYQRDIVKCVHAEKEMRLTTVRRRVFS